MSKKDETLKLALEALKYPLNQSHENFNVDMAELLAHRAITAIKEVLVQPKSERKPLTREQVREICEGSGYDKATMQERADFINGIRHAEAAHGIKE